MSVPAPDSTPVRSAEPAGLSGWAERPLRERLRWCRAWRGLIARRERELCALITADVGKPRDEALTADVLSLLEALAWLEKRAPRVLGGSGVLSNWWPALAGVGVREARVPLGRVAIIATWNYPVQLLGIQLAHALVAGNDVVVKPSEHAPRSQQLLLELALDAGKGAAVPPGALRWTEPTRQAGAALLAPGSPWGRFDHVVFTGSTGVGAQIAQVLAPSLTTSTLELSGRDSAFVLDDADARLAAASIWAGTTMNAGQTCMAPRRALVHERVYAKFLTHLGPLASGAGPRALIHEQAARTVYEQARASVALGARSITGVLEAPHARPDDDARAARWLRPLAIIDCPAHAPLVEGRHFGPALAVVRVRDEAEALAIHRACDQHLSAAIFTRDARRARALAPLLGATTVTVNDCLIPAGHPGVGVGGRGLSGWGVSRGREGLLHMTRPVYLTRTNAVVRIPPGPVAPAMVEGLASFLRWRHGRTGRRGGGRVLSDSTTGPHAGPTSTAGPETGPTTALTTAPTKAASTREVARA